MTDCLKMAARLMRYSLAGIVAVLAMASPALAKTYEVTRTNDPAPGPCKPSDCSLREAISAANARAGADTVLLRGGKAYSLAIPGANDDDNASGDLDVTDALTITSTTTRRAIVDAQGFDRVVDSEANLAIKHLELRGGTTTGSAGGGLQLGGIPPIRVSIANSQIVNNRGTTGAGISARGLARLTLTRVGVLRNAGSSGGGLSVLNTPYVLLNESTVAGNTATNGGAGIFSQDTTMTVQASTISGNVSGFNGGGIINFADAAGPSTLEVINSTIANNRAADFSGGIDNTSDSGGVANVSLNAVTVAYNNANSDGFGSGQGGGLQNGTATGNFSVRNSVIALNQGVTGPDCAGFAYSSGGHNLLGNTADCAGFVAPGDLVRSNPKIGQLASNGGSTQTIALREGSAAISNGGPGCPKTDQRGVERRNCDTGAYERG